MEFRILGPLEADDDEGNPVLLGGPKVRALLVDLLLNAGRTVSRERLIDDLWGERVPASANKMVQVHVMRLRKVLRSGVLETRPSGYAVALDRDVLDLHRFERLVAEGREALAAGEPEAASHRLREALALWRGPALAEFGEPFAIAESARLEEARLAALDDGIEADLALGRHRDLVGELEWLIAQHPYRERLRAQQMLALYRCGRQADALRAYREARRALTKELGIEPSPPLRELERRILAQDEELSAAGEAPQSSSRDAGARRPPVRYARSGDLNIAYQISGAGPLDLVLVSGFISHLEKDWEDTRHAHFLDRLASFSRLIRFDKRGTGLSDRPGDLPDLETRMDDVRAVMDAAGSERAVLFGYSEGGPMSLLFAATYPERVSALVLYGAFAARTPSEDYPWATAPAERAVYGEQIEREWGWEADMHHMCPNADRAMARWWGARARAAASPGAARALIAMNSTVDVRHVLPAIRAPTLVLHRTGDLDTRVEEGRYMAERIPGARFVELAGEDHFVAIEPDQILDEVERFLLSS
ncbi:MAG TPA: alpha/beta fold hydrolase [Solirubrobacterales bacterium]|nr:alpha/beta fold hydrolase [Solirubrobacterales bacterium]